MRSSGLHLLAPVRFYVSENPDSTATLSYKTQSYVFAPYFTDSKDDLKTVASERDDIFKTIADHAAAEKQVVGDGEARQAPSNQQIRCLSCSSS